ncbi:hypothetical protein KUC3_30180 [Alteromonas sp. KC3]|uniref:DUF885 domain-containing protein n=1 Tax=unclassified Alteromonas TaxID=2614992 RepID=UPI0019244098|nr:MULTISPECIES: DUF885 domain-containing protein [unclassified Alteromonas]BCO20161.1 hypothetical protein KUC3_30180 [Alteromonas sp. KC3]BCO24127.1 hypothetical protein KUC14_29960 [Alteromonas sp. KC14]
MKKVILWLSSLLALTVVGLGIFVTYQWHTDKPLSMRVLVDREVLKLMLSSPQMKTSLGLHHLGIDKHNYTLDNGDKLTIIEKLPDLASIKSTVSQYRDLTGQEKITQGAVIHLLDRLQALQPYQYHNYPLDTFGGLHSRFPEFMTNDHPIENKSNIESYIARLKDSARYFDNVIKGVRLRESLGIVPPYIVIENVLGQLSKFVAPAVEENTLLTTLNTKMLTLDELEHDEKLAFYQEAKEAISNYVYPSYSKMITLYEALLEVTPEGVGYWRLPEGEKAYEAYLQFFTTLDTTPDDVYTTGESEVARLQEQMLDILAKDFGFQQMTFAQAMNSFLSNDDLYFADSQEGRQALLDQMHAENEKMRAALPQLFSQPDVPDLQFIRSPLLTEENDSLARFSNNSVLVNLSDMRALPKSSLPVLTFHEGIPGHHYQTSVTSELAGLPYIISQTPFGSYMEGWAMYAEQLGYELGFYETPEEVLSYLHYDLLRSARMVIDTGIHIKRWSREKAVAYLMTEVALSQNEAEIEVDRAIVVPGSGPMYKMGQLKILSLREQLKARLGEKFSLKHFHDRVLENGALPLPLLEDLLSEKGV